MRGTHHRGRGRGSGRGHISSRQSAQPESFRDDISSASGQESDSGRSPGSVSGPSSGRRHRHRRVSPTLDPDSEYPDDPNPYPNNKQGRAQPSSEDNESQDVPSIRRNRHNFRKTVRRVHDKSGFPPSESYQGPGSGQPDYPDQNQDQYPEEQYSNSNQNQYQNQVPDQGPGQNQNLGQGPGQNQNLGQGPGQGRSQPLPIYPQQQQQFGYGQSSEPYYQGRGRGIYYPPPQQGQQLGQMTPQGRVPYVPPPSGGFGRQGYGQELAAQQGQRQGCMKGRNKIALICIGVVAALFILSTIGTLIGKYTGENKNKTTTANARRNGTIITTTTSTTRKRLIIPK